MVFIFYFSNSKFFWFGLKTINRCFGNPINSLFVVYAANEKYRSYYANNFIKRKFSWKTAIIGINIQNGKIGINLGFNIVEDEFIDPKNYEKLLKFVKDIESLKTKIGAKYVNYSGVLPSFLKKQNISISQSSTPSLIAKVMVQAIKDISIKESVFLNDDFEIIILGGRGLIGSETMILLKEQGLQPICIDNSPNDLIILKELSKNDKKKLLVNISRAGALELLTETLNRNFLVINEVYPEPQGIVLNKIYALYQIKGIKAIVIPNLNYTYSGALPCCAMIPNDKSNKLNVLFDFYKNSI